METPGSCLFVLIFLSNHLPLLASDLNAPNSSGAFMDASTNAHYSNKISLCTYELRTGRWQHAMFFLGNFVFYFGNSILFVKADEEKVITTPPPRFRRGYGGPPTPPPRCLPVQACPSKGVGLTNPPGPLSLWNLLKKGFRRR